ncbi:MAG: hypothetical protein AAB427_14955 [Chloroflexota bacterium]
MNAQRKFAPPAATLLLAASLACNLITPQAAPTAVVFPPTESASPTESAPAPGGAPAGSAEGEADWLLAARGVRASLSFNSPAGSLVIVNHSGTAVGAPALFTFDASGARFEIAVEGAKQIAEGETFKGGVTFPGEGPADSDYIGLTLGGETYGGFYAASAFASLPLAWTAPDNPSTIRPTSGTWEFAMSASTGNLGGAQCPTGPAGFASGGEAFLQVTPDGLSARLFIDGQHVFFYRVTLDQTLYRSDTLSFPAQDGSGNVVQGRVWFEFDAPDQELINGQLFWDNTLGCSAAYPFQMTLVAASELPPYVPHQGAWTINYQPPVIFCGALLLTPGPLLNLPFGPGSLTVTGGGPLPLMLNFSTTYGDLPLLQQSSSNSYVPYAFNQYLGQAIDPATGQPVLISGSIQAWALSETEMAGLVTGFGSNGCAFAAPFTLEFVG